MFSNLPCLRCTEQDTVSLHLYDGSFSCSEFGEGWCRADVEDFISQWQHVLAWLDSATYQGTNGKAVSQ